MCVCGRGGEGLPVRVVKRKREGGVLPPGDRATLPRASGAPRLCPESPQIRDAQLAPDETQILSLLFVRQHRRRARDTPKTGELLRREKLKERGESPQYLITDHPCHEQRPLFLFRLLRPARPGPASCRLGFRMLSARVLGDVCGSSAPLRPQGGRHVRAVAE